MATLLQKLITVFVISVVGHHCGSYSLGQNYVFECESLLVLGCPDGVQMGCFSLRMKIPRLWSPKWSSVGCSICSSDDQTWSMKLDRPGVQTPETDQELKPGTW